VQGGELAGFEEAKEADAIREAATAQLAFQGAESWLGLGDSAGVMDVHSRLVNISSERGRYQEKRKGEEHDRSWESRRQPLCQPPLPDSLSLESNIAYSEQARLASHPACLIAKRNPPEKF
jgi:hypothetical protein